jgi:HEAT repeat protein
MIGTGKTVCRHAAETEMLLRALEGDLLSVSKVLNYLSSSNKYLRQIMQEAIHDLENQEMWEKLLRCLAEQRWNHHQDCPRREDAEASKRIDLSIEEAFIEDESEWEKRIKEKILSEALDDKSQLVRWASACLLGLRGHLNMIPILSEMIDYGLLEWQLRAIKALVGLNHEECGPPLLNALAKNRDRLHQEALRALTGMGEKARLAWLSALSHPNSHIRWHAARGLGQIGDASSINILAEGLLDPNHAVRWATADLLAYLGEISVPAVLKLLIQQPLAEPFRQATYHALRGITDQEAQERLRPLVKALRRPTARLEAPAEAQRLLKLVEK